MNRFEWEYSWGTFRSLLYTFFLNYLYHLSFLCLSFASHMSPLYLCRALCDSHEPQGSLSKPFVSFSAPGYCWSLLGQWSKDRSPFLPLFFPLAFKEAICSGLLLLRPTTFLHRSDNYLATNRIYKICVLVPY